MKTTLLFLLACLLLVAQHLAYHEWQKMLKLAKVNPDDPGILPSFLFVMLLGVVSVMASGLSVVVYLWIP